MSTKSLLSVLFLYKYAKQQTENGSPISPHPSIRHGKKQEKKPGVLKSLRELAQGDMKTWILFLRRFNYSHQKKNKLSREEQGYLLFLICKYGSDFFTV